MSDHDFEPIPGLPAELPPGESVVWRGRPRWLPLARRAFKLHWLAAYLGALVTLRALLAPDALGLLIATFLAAFCLAIVLLLAWLHARTTLYTITTRRVVMRVGVALPITWNLPFARMASADLEVRKDGDVDLVLRLAPPDRIAWAVLWPHAHGFFRAQPALRGLPEPERVARLLGEAVRAWAGTRETTIASTSRAPEPARSLELAAEAP